MKASQPFNNRSYLHLLLSIWLTDDAVEAVTLSKIKLNSEFLL